MTSRSLLCELVSSAFPSAFWGTWHPSYMLPPGQIHRLPCSWPKTSNTHLLNFIGSCSISQLWQIKRMKATIGFKITSDSQIRIQMEGRGIMKRFWTCVCILNLVHLLRMLRRDLSGLLSLSKNLPMSRHPGQESPGLSGRVSKTGPWNGNQKCNLARISLTLSFLLLS